MLIALTEHDSLQVPGHKLQAHPLQLLRMVLFRQRQGGCHRLHLLSHTSLQSSSRHCQTLIVCHMNHTLSRDCSTSVRGGAIIEINHAHNFASARSAVALGKPCWALHSITDGRAGHHILGHTTLSSISTASCRRSPRQSHTGGARRCGAGGSAGIGQQPPANAVP